MPDDIDCQAQPDLRLLAFTESVGRLSFSECERVLILADIYTFVQYIFGQQQKKGSARWRAEKVWNWPANVLRSTRGVLRSLCRRCRARWKELCLLIAPEFRSASILDVESGDSMSVMQQLEAVLTSPQLRRADTGAVEVAFAKITSETATTLKEFFLRFRGPIGSTATGFQLLDIVDDDPSIRSATELVRKKFALGPEWLVLSDVLANGALFYNAKTDQVFDVDFEGGVELLQDGKLPARWHSFDDFLTFFFGLRLGPE